jgi:phage-related protein
MRRHPAKNEKPLVWMGSSRRDLLAFPERVVSRMGYALSWAQFGRKHSATKHWKGVGARVLEIVEDFDGNSYRAIYTVRFERAVYVLHCFQKKSPRRIKTARLDVEMVTRRLAAAEADNEACHGQT